jgi:hypothetical protein
MIARQVSDNSLAGEKVETIIWFHKTSFTDFTYTSHRFDCGEVGSR